MKKEERLVYLELAKEVNAQLCTFCRYGEGESEGCCEGYCYCVHPIDKLADSENMISPGDDCWGFKPDMTVSLLADLVGAIVSQGWEEWAFIRYGPESLTVFGRYQEQGQESSGKVRIGYEPKDKPAISPDLR
jgi:hypothetical protein